MHTLTVSVITQTRIRPAQSGGDSGQRALHDAGFDLDRRATLVSLRFEGATAQAHWMQAVRARLICAFGRGCQTIKPNARAIIQE